MKEKISRVKADRLQKERSSEEEGNSLRERKDGQQKKGAQIKKIGLNNDENTQGKVWSSKKELMKRKI